jgi:hypothetical protein
VPVATTRRRMRGCRGHESTPTDTCQSGYRGYAVPGVWARASAAGTGWRSRSRVRYGMNRSDDGLDCCKMESRSGYGWWWVPEVGGGGARRFAMSSMQAGLSQTGPGKLETQRSGDGGESCVPRKHNQAIKRLTFFRCLGSQREPKKQQSGRHAVVWEATGPRGSIYWPQTEFRILAAHCNAFRRLTHTHTHLAWPSTTRANGLAPTGQPMVPIARIPWLPAPVRRGREVEEESVEPKGGAAVLPCKGLDTCTPRRSKSSGLAPLLSDGPRAHDLWGQQKRCAAVEPSERLRPLRTSARGTGIINGFPDSTTLLCTSWTATFWLFRRCGGVLFQSSSSDRAAQETRVFAWPAVGGSSKPRSLHNTSAETETERETLMWTRDGEQFSPGGIGPENI